MSRHLRANLTQGRQNPEERQGTTIYHRRIVDSHLKRTVRASLELHVYPEVAPQHRRRPGSLNGGDSINAPLDYHFGHRTIQ